MVRTVIKQPVKEAVHEALAEESDIPSASRSTEKSNRFVRPGLLVPLFGLAAAAFYWRRRKADPFGPGGPAGEGTTTSGASTDREAGASSGRQDGLAGSSEGGGGPAEPGADEEAERAS